MTNAEKIKSIEHIVFDFACKEFSSLHMDAVTAEIVMGNIYRKFQENAYRVLLLKQYVESRSNDEKEQSQGQAHPQNESVQKNMRREDAK